MDSGGYIIEPNVAPEIAALDWLERQGEISQQDISHGKSLQENSQKSLLSILNQIGIINDRALAQALSLVTDIEVVSEPISSFSKAKTDLNPEFLRDSQSLLVNDDALLLVVNPLNERLFRGIEYALGNTPQVKIIHSGDWQHLFQQHHPESNAINAQDIEQEQSLLSEIADTERDAPTVRQVNSWISQAIDIGASDVHFETRKTSFNVHYRLDGILHPADSQPKPISAAIISRIKVIADLDLGERHKPQDGRSSIVVRGRRVDIRVSIIPTIDGESAVIRLLDRPEGMLSLSELGFNADIIGQLNEVTSRGHGMFVVAGPTGSGKTTTLYACLEALKGKGLKILSVEDPVEYHFDHVSQVQISEKTGRSFANVLRSFLRHDPDVILVGEIRDNETAEIAVQASLSGHLVLATIHAIDTPRVKTRLTDMGIDPFKLDACLVGSMAQRLIRKLCPNCRIPEPVSSDIQMLFDAYNIPIPDKIYKADGCPECRHEGYKGRIALAEVSTNGQDSAPKKSLKVNGLELLANGETSFSELMGVTDI